MLKKVLIVEDSQLVQNMYQMILKRYDGCSLVKAKNGQEALEKLASDPNVDLILLDINMPVMSGVEFLETIHKQGVYRHIPVIIISTEGKEEDLKKGLALGARAYITKPFQSITLHNLIEQVISKKPSPSAGD